MFYEAFDVRWVIKILASILPQIEFPILIQMGNSS